MKLKLDKDDGFFFMPAEDIKKAFEKITVAQSSDKLKKHVYPVV